jgi:succinyl-diaminopimelate desuccinylase
VPRWHARLDTAPFGDEAAWTYPPASGEITAGWMHGRGSADSKAGAAIFAHVAGRLRHHADLLHGSAALLFDVDEHTGSFGGAKAYFEGPDASARVDGVLIGYPGLDHVVTGGRVCCASGLSATSQADGHRDQRRRGIFERAGPVHLQC